MNEIDEVEVLKSIWTPYQRMTYTLNGNRANHVRQDVLCKCTSASLYSRQIGALTSIPAALDMIDLERSYTKVVTLLLHVSCSAGDPEHVKPPRL